jgi:hypothetical protein
LALRESQISSNNVAFFQSYSSETFLLDGPLSSLLDYQLARLQDARLRRKLKSTGMEFGKYKLISREIKVTVSSEDLKIGFAETISKTRDGKPCPLHLQKAISHYAKLYRQTYEQALRFLSERKPDCIYIFNGRFYRERGIWKAALELGIQVLFVERFSPSWEDRYFVFSKPVHDIKYRCDVIREYWDIFCAKYGKEKAYEVSHKWFKDRSKGLSQTFTTNQHGKFTIQSENEITVAFFQSSDDELYTTSLGESVWTDQIDFLKNLVDKLKELPNIHLVVRLHPNLRNKSKREIARWRELANELNSKKCTFILHDSPVNTYDILEKSNFVITYGSTIGVEASYICKPSILVSNAFHESLQVVSKVESIEEIFEILKNRPSEDVLAQYSANARKYALFYASGGIHISYLQKANQRIQDPSFHLKGVRIGTWRLISGLRLIEGKLLDFLAPKLASNCNCDYPR